MGRSLAFSEWAIPHWSKHFPQNMEGVTGEMLWRSVNMVEPSLIRVEADEATYNIHIMIRYEIEKRLINGELDIDDLPDAWDDMYEHIGHRPQTKARSLAGHSLVNGCLRLLPHIHSG